LDSLISQQGKQFTFDVVVMGGGIAGLIYILELIQQKPRTRIALITKKTLTDSNSLHAQGGIASVALPMDSIDSHVEDTLKAGDGLSDPVIVEKILSAAPTAIEQLKAYGVQFDQGELAQEGGHSKRRIHHVGDYTGQAITQTLIDAVKRFSQVRIFENHTAVNLITQSTSHASTSASEVMGAYVLDELKEKIHVFLAKIIVLATGGAGKVYRYTSNQDIATGDGVAMAYRAGARVSNLEFYQFHPTLLYHPDRNNFLITEALRGEGAYLINPTTHERFMKHYAPKQMELATRDIVARAIFNEIEHNEKDYVYLDIRHRDKAYLKKRFPSIFKTLCELGLDISQDFIPVVPAAHYLCGGILTDTTGKTDIDRLFAIGETACTGLHGANRLASNSLIENVVMASFAAKASLSLLDRPMILSQPISAWNSQSVIDRRRASQINAHWRGLRGEMTSYAGIIRTEAGLKDALRLVSARKKIIENCYWQYSITRDLIELRNIVLIAELIIRSAIKRQESRGGHYREDYPNKLNKSKPSIMRCNLSSRKSSC